MPKLHRGEIQESSFYFLCRCLSDFWIHGSSSERSPKKKSKFLKKTTVSTSRSARSPLPKTAECLRSQRPLRRCPCPPPTESGKTGLRTGTENTATTSTTSNSTKHTGSSCENWVTLRNTPAKFISVHALY